MDATAIKSDIGGVSPYVLALRSALQARSGSRVTKFGVGELAIEVRAVGDSLWAIIRRPGRGGLALRCAFLAGPFKWTKLKPKTGEAARVRLHSALGKHLIVFGAQSGALEHLRMTTRFTPSAPMVVPFMPRDLYPLDANDDPLGARGRVEAAQRGLNVGILYFRIDEPAFGNVLYFQNLTAMNDYYRATKTKPDGAVGGEWPELGYLIPTPPQSGTPPTDALAAKKEITLSDAVIVFRGDAPSQERESARQFLQMLGVAYRRADIPPTDYRDWIERSERTLRDLEKAPEATVRHYGNLYVHPYTDAEYPDTMVQLSLLAAIHDWGRWCGTPHPLEAALKRGLGKFYDDDLKTLRRYLPNVGKDKDADAVDSWYLYHPLLNLGLLALDGDADARDLFVKSIDFGVKAAHHFDYKWPIQYKITDFSVITEAAEDGRGQTDVGGLYAWVMLQAYELTSDEHFLHEARVAIDAAMGMRFNLNYQANLTAWGAAACMRLWRVTNENVYLEQSYVYLASFFHNCAIWESRIGFAEHYKNFLGVTSLQDAPYLAMYELFDSYQAFEHYLDSSGPELEPAARMLVSDYCKYALGRAWYYYPDALPPEAISPKQRENNGHVDRKLSFPVEDLYVDGQPAGQVGQQVYGAGAAFIFATRAFHQVEGAPFILYCDHFLRARERTNPQTLTFVLGGDEIGTASVSLVRRKRRKLTAIRLREVGGEEIEPRTVSADRLDYLLPATGRFALSWE